ncbi:unnamed protein product [Acanthoscelides obtectus]|uniref:Uncharacterized protein n=1 Tax=Acanthoscelides obtectus TaxID=200917 RepID=A0A9P0K3H4_ACAOB|nr:unnamed protein product [Acanthoscelides obtectus]CAK1622611.1 hypothetical protein AOBTE_LOCUS1590 [Acanthoscelides obtectus]
MKLFLKPVEKQIDLNTEHPGASSSLYYMFVAASIHFLYI